VFLEKYFHTAIKSPTRFQTFNLNNKTGGMSSPYAKRISSMFSPNSINSNLSKTESESSFDPFDIVVGDRVARSNDDRDLYLDFQDVRI
jgi:hypothetical protein